MNIGLRKLAEDARADFEKRISDLADLRMQWLAVEWHRTAERGLKLEVLFGNGTEHVKIGGRWHGGIGEPDVPRMVQDAIDDVLDITNGYMDGCPEDIHEKGGYIV